MIKIIVYFVIVIVFVSGSELKTFIIKVNVIKFLYIAQCPVLRIDLIGIHFTPCRPVQMKRITACSN